MRLCTGVGSERRDAQSVSICVEHCPAFVNRGVQIKVGSSVRSLRGCDAGEWKLGVDRREYVRLVQTSLLPLSRGEYTCVVGVDRGVCGGYSCVHPGEMGVTGVDRAVAGVWAGDVVAETGDMVETGVESELSQ